MLRDVAAEAAGCTRCRLSAGRTQVVFGDGSPDADLMFIGEGPGFHEDKQGIPFVGAAGQLLDRLLREIGLSRAEVWITNTVLCRPPGNRDPLPDEIESCKPYLVQQISLVDPRVIVTLGNFATRFMLGRPVAISRVRGQRQVVGGRLVIPTFHPAAVLHGGGDASAPMRALREDFATIRAALDEAAPAVPQEQLGLF
ncbi:MAG TPA: uracil-DNA glycosylase [Actinomycetota bacterium]|nr:uracil-DNA glycosylase [Actinomycetota bacterium]